MMTLSHKLVHSGWPWPWLWPCLWQACHLCQCCMAVLVNRRECGLGFGGYYCQCQLLIEWYGPG